MKATVTHWDLINCSEDVRLAMADITDLTVLGYSEEAFPQVEQRYMTAPRLRGHVADLMRGGRVHWHCAADWRDYDRILAWRGAPVPCNVEPELHWVCQNLNHRPYRYDFVTALAQADWLWSSAVSYGNQSIWWDDCECGRYHYNEEDRGKNPLIQQLTPHFPPDPRYADPQWQAVGTVEMPAPPVHIWENSATNLVTETDRETAYPTEKTWQAMLYGRPFVIVGGAHSIAHLEAQGYSFSNNVIDHRSYDTIEHAKNRLNSVLAQMETLRDWQPQDIYAAQFSSAQQNQRRLIQQIADARLPKAVKHSDRNWCSKNAQSFVSHCQRVIGAAQAWLK